MIMANKVEQTRKPTNSFMILSTNDFVVFRFSQSGKVLKNDIERSLVA